MAGAVMTRLATDPDPRARQTGLDLLSHERVAYTVFGDQAGLDLLWEAWLRHGNPECLERLIGCGDPRAAGAARAVLADDSTPEEQVGKLMSAGWQSRDPSLAGSVSAAAEQGRVDLSTALLALIGMGALDDARALITPAMLDDVDQGELWRGYVQMIADQRK